MLDTLSGEFIFFKSIVEFKCKIHRQIDFLNCFIFIFRDRYSAERESETPTKSVLCDMQIQTCVLCAATLHTSRVLFGLRTNMPDMPSLQGKC